MIIKAIGAMTGGLLLTATVAAQIPNPIHGVTVEDTNDVTTEPFQTHVVTALGALSERPTTRIVFSPPRPASDYAAAVAR
ncbi:MAG: hypothetical protein ACRD3S_10805, partial [Terracidiphilus sp.]